MEVKFRIYNDNSPVYQAKYEEFIEDTKDYYDELLGGEDDDEDSGPSDPLLRDLLRDDSSESKKKRSVILPQPPEPPVVYVKGKIKNSLIMGYHVLPDKIGIRLMMDHRLIEQSTTIIKYDDKIIEELDSILD